MQCPKCGTNIYGNAKKCLACGTILTEQLNSENKDINRNGLLDQRDLDNYTKNIELYKTKNKEPNILIPILIILGILGILIIIAIFKLIKY